MNDVALPQFDNTTAMFTENRAASVGETDKGEPRFSLSTYLNFLRRRKWIIGGGVVTAFLLGLVLTLLTTPQYTATTRLEIQRENLNIVRVKGVEPESSPVDQEFYQTQYGLLKSEALGRRVAEYLRLYDNAAFFEMFKFGKAKDWFENGRVVPRKSTRDQRIQAAGALLLQHVDVAPLRLSRLVDVSFTSPDPVFSKKIVDAWSENFVESTLARKMNATAYARNYLEKRLAELRAKIDESERQLVTYATEQGIVNLPSSSAISGDGIAPAERSIVADDLVALNRSLATATARRIAAQSRLNSPAAATSEALDNKAITDLRSRLAELRSSYAQMMVQFEPDYPPAKALRQQIDSLSSAVATEERRVRDTIQSEYSAALREEGQLQARVSGLKGDLLEQRRRSIQYNVLDREVDTNRQLYDALLQRYKEIGVAGGVGLNNISVIDPPEVPTGPSSPNLIVNLMLSLIAGLGLGLIIAMIREQLDDAISDPTQIQQALGYPALGVIPDKPDEDVLAAIQDPKSDLSEAYLSVQTSLSFTTAHGLPRNILITSSRPAEGKSTTAFALARMIARTGRRVVLIDCDMRSPSVHHLLDLTNPKGLSNYLAGDDDLPSLIQQVGEWGISAMTAGPQPPNAAELLSGSRLVKLLEVLADRFDHVVLDAPPVMGLADAPLIARTVEGVVFVVRANSTGKGAAQIAIRRLRDAHAQIFGAVLTRFQSKNSFYGYGYEYGYGYGRADAGPDAGTA